MQTFINPIHARQLSGPISVSDAVRLVRSNAIHPSASFTRVADQSYFDAAGELDIAPNNTPTFTTEYGVRGLQIYEDSENRVIQNNINIFNNSLASLTKGQTGLAGTATARRMDEGVSTLYHAATDSASQQYLAGREWVISVFVKPETCEYVQLLVSSAIDSTAWVNIELKGDGKVTKSGGGEIRSGIHKIPNSDWYRVQMTVDGNNATGQSFLAMLQDGQENRLDGFNGTNRTVLIDGWQLENGFTVASPYIPNTNAVSLRPQTDNLMLTGSDFSDIWNDGEGSFIIDWYDPIGSRAVNAALLSISNGSGANRIEIITGSQRLPRVTSGGTTSVNMNIPNPAKGDNVDVITFDADGFDYFLNGTHAVDDNNVTIPSAVNRMGIGVSSTGTSGPINAVIKSVTYYPRKIDNSDALAASAKYIDFLVGGDSYMAGSGNIGLASGLIANNYQLANVSQGGLSLDAAVTAVENADLSPFKKLIFFDGSVNNHGTVTQDMAKYARLITATNGNLIIISPTLYSNLATGNIPDAQHSLNLTSALIAQYGSNLIIDSTAIARSLSGATFTDAMNANDAGYRSTMYDALFQSDNIHMGQALCDAITNAVITLL
jgi:hypothetical protein